MVTIQQWPKWLMVSLFAARTTRKLKRLIKTAKFFQFQILLKNCQDTALKTLTLDGMIYFLIVIAAFIIGIFIFVMTLQKTAMFGVLKVQGVPTSFLAKAVMLQTALLAVLGVAIGLALTGITVLFLPEAMPYATNGPRMILFSVLLILSALIGGHFQFERLLKLIR